MQGDAASVSSIAKASLGVRAAAAAMHYTVPIFNIQSISKPTFDSEKKSEKLRITRIQYLHSLYVVKSLSLSLKHFADKFFLPIKEYLT